MLPEEGTKGGEQSTGKTGEEEAVDPHCTSVSYERSFVELSLSNRRVMKMAKDRPKEMIGGFIGVVPKVSIGFDDNSNIDRRE